MAATHQFTQTINIGPQRYDAGRQINATEIPKGNFDSLTRLGVLVPVPVIANVAPLRTPEPEPTLADETTGDDPEAAAEKEAAKAKAAAEAAAEAEAAKAKATTKKK